MPTIRNAPSYFRAFLVIGAILAGVAGFISPHAVAQAATPVDLTTLNDAEVSAYRWQAMAQFYAGQTATQNLTTLSDAEVSAYRWQAMAAFYADQAAPTALTTP